MRVTTRTGRNTYVSIGCGGLLLMFLVVLGLIGWAENAARGHAATSPHYAVTESYGWPQRGVTQRGEDCLAAASVTFLETYGVHVSQDQFYSQDREENVGHAGVLINGYLRARHVRVVAAGAMDAAHLRLLLEASGGPVLASAWTQNLPWWHGRHSSATHEVMIEALTLTGVRIWDPVWGWHTAPVATVAAAAWEYLVP